MNEKAKVIHEAICFAAPAKKGLGNHDYAAPQTSFNEQGGTPPPEIRGS